MTDAAQGQQVGETWGMGLRSKTFSLAGPSVYRNLVIKELMLQKPVFVLAGLLIACWIVALVVRWVSASLNVPGFGVLVTSLVFLILTGFYGIILPLLVGSLMFAEERALGTADWQRTLPKSWLPQWGIKIAVAALILVVLGLGVPLVLAMFAPAKTLVDGKEPATWVQVIQVVAIGWLLMPIAAWASSISTNVVRSITLTLFTCALLALCLWLGSRLGEELVPLGVVCLTWFLAMSQRASGELSPIVYAWNGGLADLVLIIAVGVFALFQTVHAFRTPRRMWLRTWLVIAPVLTIVLIVGSKLDATAAAGCAALVPLLYYILKRRVFAVSHPPVPQGFGAGAVLLAFTLLLATFWSGFGKSAVRVVQDGRPDNEAIQFVSEALRRVGAAPQAGRISARVEELEGYQDWPAPVRQWLRGATVELETLETKGGQGKVVRGSLLLPNGIFYGPFTVSPQPGIGFMRRYGL